MATRTHLRPRGLSAALALLLAFSLQSAHAATITIVNADGPGEGFNDPTPVAPVGGNAGVTVGEQRLIVLQTAASIWGGILTSNVPIVVKASFDDLTCTASTAVLGSAGTAKVFRDFQGVEFTGTWYHGALADKEAGRDLDPGPEDIRAYFNSGIGGANCLAGASWYYGLDGNEGSQIELLPVMLHELAHGLGFATFVDDATGALLSGYPDVYSRFILDTSANLQWNDMNDSERAASAINTSHVVWNGAAVTAKAPTILSRRPVLTVQSPPAVAGVMQAGAASFGPPLTTAGVTGTVAQADDGAAPGSDACTALVNGAQIQGRIALVDRGTCNFTVKVKNAQDAGAIGVIVVDNVPGSPPGGMSGSDPTITIPSVRVTQADGNAIRAQLANGVVATLGLSPTLYAGADGSGRMLLYTPDPLQPGSSVSHWDASAVPNLLMEPAINASLSRDVDLTRYQFEDIGWTPRATVPRPPAVQQLGRGAPNPFAAATTIHFKLEHAGLATMEVYDLAGRLVKRLLRASLVAGPDSVRWDGTDRDGRPVPTGVYLCRLKAGGSSETRHIVRVE